MLFQSCQHDLVNSVHVQACGTRWRGLGWELQRVSVFGGRERGGGSQPANGFFQFFPAVFFNSAQEKRCPTDTTVVHSKGCWVTLCKTGRRPTLAHVQSSGKHWWKPFVGSRSVNTTPVGHLAHHSGSPPKSFPSSTVHRQSYYQTEENIPRQLGRTVGETLGV